MDLTYDIELAVKNGHNIAFLGQAGTGKSFIVKKLYHKLKNSGRNVKITATTGIASTVLPEASTVHSFLDFKTDDTVLINLSKKFVMMITLMLSKQEFLKLKLYSLMKCQYCLLNFSLTLMPCVGL